MKKKIRFLAVMVCMVVIVSVYYPLCKRLVAASRDDGYSTMVRELPSGTVEVRVIHPNESAIVFNLGDWRNDGLAGDGNYDVAVKELLDGTVEVRTTRPDKPPKVTILDGWKIENLRGEGSHPERKKVRGVNR